MSAPDARLSAAERAALADLEAAASADDPHLATRLKGAPSSRLRTFLPTVAPTALALWSRFLKLRWWGAALTLAGLALMALGLSTSPVVSLLGVVVSLAGLRLLAEVLVGRTRRPHPKQGD